jgi:rhodanese-related sulfurtransferase
VYTFIGGIPEWRKFNYPMTFNEKWRKVRIKRLTPEDLVSLMEQQNLYILDVRPLNFKRNTSFVKGSHLCPLVYLEDKYHEIPKDRPIVITDWAMKQSPVAAKFLTVKGYKIVGVLKGGLERWESEHLLIEKRKPFKSIDALNLIDSE